jgi:hypothetical protein
MMPSPTPRMLTDRPTSARRRAAGDGLPKDLATSARAVGRAELGEARGRGERPGREDRRIAPAVEP